MLRGKHPSTVLACLISLTWSSLAVATDTIPPPSARTRLVLHVEAGHGYSPMLRKAGRPLASGNLGLVLSDVFTLGGYAGSSTWDEHTLIDGGLELGAIFWSNWLHLRARLGHTATLPVEQTFLTGYNVSGHAFVRVLGRGSLEVHESRPVLDIGLGYTTWFLNTAHGPDGTIRRDHAGWCGRSHHDVLLVALRFGAEHGVSLQ